MPGDYKSRLLKLIERAHAEEQALRARPSEAERNAAGTPEHWAVKDLLAHIAYWQDRATERMAAARRGETPETFDEFQDLNARNFEASRHKTWAEVTAWAEQAYAQFRAAAEALSEAELTEADRYAWRKGVPLSQMVVGNGCSHNLLHLAQNLAERGEMKEAATMQEWLAQALIGLDDSPANRGAAIYNLACFYATTGQPAKALPLLRDSLGLRDDLIEWSKQDTDLDSLREMAEFRALYAPGEK